MRLNPLSAGLGLGYVRSHRSHCNHFLPQDADKYAELKKKRTFKKFTYRGIELEGLLDLGSEELAQLVSCRARRRFSRGMQECCAVE